MLMLSGIMLHINAIAAQSDRQMIVFYIFVGENTKAVFS